MHLLNLLASHRLNGVPVATIDEPAIVAMVERFNFAVDDKEDEGEVEEDGEDKGEEVRDDRKMARGGD